MVGLAGTDKPMDLTALLNAGDGQGSDEHFWQLVLQRNQRCKDCLGVRTKLAFYIMIIMFKVILVMKKRKRCFREVVLQSWFCWSGRQHRGSSPSLFSARCHHWSAAVLRRPHSGRFLSLSTCEHETSAGIEEDGHNTPWQSEVIFQQSVLIVLIGFVWLPPFLLRILRTP